jgi:membrane protein YqaA with SNARE-associated domain
LSDSTDADLELDGALGRASVAGLVWRFVLGLVIVCSLVALAGYFVREPAEALARGFVTRFGVWGMALGTLLADGLHFPVPPQFYMLLAVASSTPLASAFPAISVASLLAGALGYTLARWASGAKWLSKKVGPYSRLLARSFSRRGYRTALLASLLPIPYSMLCYLAGLNRLPTLFVVLLGLCRVPKLLGFYGLVYYGWSMF